MKHLKGFLSTMPLFTKIKKFDKFFFGLKRVSGDFRSSRFQNLPGEHTPGYPVSSLSVLRKAY